MKKEKIATQYLFTDLAIKNLERDLQLVKKGSFKIKEPYIEIIEGFIAKAINERKQLKQLMYKNKLRVQYVGKHGHFVMYTFYLDGSVQDITFHESVIKNNVKRVIGRLEYKEK